MPAFVVPCCFNERVPCSRPGMARSTRRSKPDQRGAETLGGLPAQLHAIRKVGFDQLVRENALQRHRRRGSCLLPLEGLEKLGAALAFLAELKSGRLRNGADNSGRPRCIGAKSWEIGLCPPEHGSPSLAAALITCGGVEARLQREGRDSDFQQNEAHKVTLVTSTPAPRMFIPLWYPGMVSAGRTR